MTKRYDVVEAICRRFEKGLHGTPGYDTEQMVQLLDELGVMPREGESNIELIHMPAVGSTPPGAIIVMTDPDGGSKHVTFYDSWWVAGKPRPTEEGVYQDPENPLNIYTLYSNGKWASNRGMSPGKFIDIKHVPDNLTKIA